MQPQYPSIGDRIQSIFIDSTLLILAMFALSSLLDEYENPPEWIRIVFFFAIWGIYEPVCTIIGGTIGQLVKGIRVRRYSNPERRINIFQAMFRYIFKIAFGWLSFITVHFNEERRAIHDIFSGTVMVKVGSNSGM
ncbi:RDD family protein [Foetidibacter luteolus]|uniref:RDD family protein n=1 Tax=Foetidibacter luteolus TaxID=2608880 RepID=UPI001A9806FA|nr:RDD family protein [Foetidibacter luteolus]